MTQDADSFDGALGSVISEATVRALRLVAIAAIANAVIMLVIAIGTPAGSISIGLCLGWTLVWIFFRSEAWRLLPFLIERPWLVPLAALVGKLLIVFDGGFEGMASTQVVWLALVAAIIGSWRTVLLTLAALTVGEVAAVLAVNLSPAELIHHPDRLRMASEVFSALILSLSAIVLVGTFRSNLSEAPTRIAAIRAGGPASTPALGAVIRMAAHELAPGPSPTSDPHELEAPPGADDPLGKLTTAEREVIEMLAEGLAPKQIAHERGTSLATVRTQIKVAKRKSGAKTINELVAMKWRRN